MLDGFLLFSVLDVWRVLLPLGLSVICLGTLAFQWLVGGSTHIRLSPFLCLLSYRVTVTLAVISAVVGIIVPWILGISLPEAHLANGPWSKEEIGGYFLGLVLLWRLQQQVQKRQPLSGLMITCAMTLFLWVGLFWTVRGDVMVNMGHVPGGWFLESWPQWEWLRIIPKSFHLLFSAMVAGGVVVAILGIRGMLTPGFLTGSPHGESPSGSPELIRYGMGWILSGLVPQMLIGPWLFLLLHNRPQMILIEGTTLTSVIFFVSLTAALLALVFLNASFMVPHVKGLVWGGLGNVSLTLALMGIIRYETFGATLFAHNVPLAMAELSGWHVTSVFVLLLLLGVLLVRWCVWPSLFIFHANLPTAELDKL